MPDSNRPRGRLKVAVIIEAFDVVGLVEGPSSAGFAELVPNSTFCTDGLLVRASFMAGEDRRDFVAKVLAALPSLTLAEVDAHFLKEPGEPWLGTGRYSGALAAWKRDGPPGPLVVPVYWRPGVEFHSPEEAQHLELIGREGAVEVYRDRRTGQKHYRAQLGARPLPEAELVRLEAMRARGVELLGPLVKRRQKPGFFERRRMKKGLALLESVLEALPNHWAAAWTAGMGYRALGEHQRALAPFRQAYQVNSANPDVGREYAIQCLALGEGAEAVKVSRALVERFPREVGLQSNLSVALLVGGDLHEALSVARQALGRDPGDAVTRGVVGYIEDVIAGRKERPARLPPPP